MTHTRAAQALGAVAARLRTARSVLFITGAGMSADSGLPTYRGIGGLYDRAATDEGYPIEVALSGTMLEARPAVCWKYIAQIEHACRGAAPNRGHAVLAEIEQEAGLERCVVLTQNVDGFHLAAGSREVIEIHGNVHHLSCTACRWKHSVPDYADLHLPPACPDCGALVRPDVVLFGEALPAHALAAMHAHLAHGFDAVLSIGTTSVFPYIAEPVYRTNARGGYTVEINPGETEVSHAVKQRVIAPAAGALDALWSAWRERAEPRAAH